MIEIKVNRPDDLIEPSEMISNKWREGQVFQIYSNGVPDTSYFIHCGLNEPRLVHLWYNSFGDQKYGLSTSDSEDLKLYHPHIMARPIEAKVRIELT
jgi:hypothetical protein